MSFFTIRQGDISKKIDANSIVCVYDESSYSMRCSVIITYVDNIFYKYIEPELRTFDTDTYYKRSSGYYCNYIKPLLNTFDMCPYYVHCCDYIFNLNHTKYLMLDYKKNRICVYLTNDKYHQHKIKYTDQLIKIDHRIKTYSDTLSTDYLIIKNARIFLCINMSFIKNIELKEKTNIYGKIEYCSKITLDNNKIIRYKLPCVYDGLKNNNNDILLDNMIQIDETQFDKNQTLLEYMYALNDNKYYARLLNIPIDDITYIVVQSMLINIGYKVKYVDCCLFFKSSYDNTIIVNDLSGAINNIMKEHWYISKTFIVPHNIYYAKHFKNVINIYFSKIKINVYSSNKYYQQLINILTSDKFLSIRYRGCTYYYDYDSIYRIILTEYIYKCCLVWSHKTKYIYNKKIYLQLINDSKAQNKIIKY